MKQKEKRREERRKERREEKEKKIEKRKEKHLLVFCLFHYQFALRLLFWPLPMGLLQGSIWYLLPFPLHYVLNVNTISRLMSSIYISPDIWVLLTESHTQPPF